MSPAFGSSAATDWDSGPGASLRCGLAALGAEVERAVIVLADGPDLDPRAVERVLDTRRAPSSRPATTAPAATRSRSREAPGARSRTPAGRALDPVLVDCSDLQPPGDVDVRR